MQMKRYALFGGKFYYPEGGWGDFVATADSVEEIRPPLVDGACWRIPGGGLFFDQTFSYGDKSLDWWQIIDLQTGKKICDGSERQVCVRQPDPPAPDNRPPANANNPPAGVPVDVDGKTIGFADQISFSGPEGQQEQSDAE